MENVNSKNKKLTIIVGALLLVVGISFAYFIATTLINGNGSSVVGATARIKGAEINIEGTLEFNDTDVYPGHKNVSAIKVTATGNNQLIPYNLIWKGESGISQINFTVYKSSTPKTLSTNCERKTGVQNGLQVLSEECTISNLDTLGEAIASGSISKEDTKEILAQDEFITATTDGDTKYYYVVLEYPNLDEDQSSDANATFKGEVTVEESNKEADINILAVYVADDSGNYQETTDIPQEGYTINKSKSTCSNGAAVRWDYDKKELITSNLTKSGTSCYLYFDVYQPTAENTLAKLNIINYAEQTGITPDFSKTAKINEGIFKAADGMYGGNTYYWRGAAITNYLKFAGYCWRIVRINGDGSIRLIYDGATCHANGTNTTESIALTSQKYNASCNKNEYAGYTYTEGSQRTLSGTASDLKIQTENWINSNLPGLNTNKLAIGKFCNDRNTVIGSVWASQPATKQYYAAYGRLVDNKKPTFDCPDEDIYEVKTGAITADEVAFAGGVSKMINEQYYLYNGQYYWTMTPFGFDYDSSSRPYTQVFYMFYNGYVGSNSTVEYTKPGIRPVINLRSDITISSGNGTLDTPYIVAD